MDDFQIEVRYEETFWGFWHDWNALFAALPPQVFDCQWQLSFYEDVNTAILRFIPKEA